MTLVWGRQAVKDGAGEREQASSPWTPAKGSSGTELAFLIGPGWSVVLFFFFFMECGSGWFCGGVFGSTEEEKLGGAHGILSLAPFNCGHTHMTHPVSKTPPPRTPPRKALLAILLRDPTQTVEG